jgi:hypothetical protein
MDATTSYFAETSLAGAFAPVVLVLLIVDLALTLIHSNQERKGHLWRYFGAIAGVRIPDVVGFLSFFVLLTLALWALGFIGITGGLPLYGAVPGAVAIGELAALIGGRLSDRLYSHIRLDRQGYRPNPGLESTRYYLIEAIVLAVVFIPGLIMHYQAAALGFVIGWGAFYVIIPALRLLRVVPLLRQEPWTVGKPLAS